MSAYLDLARWQFRVTNGGAYFLLPFQALEWSVLGMQSVDSTILSSIPYRKAQDSRRHRSGQKPAILVITTKYWSWLMY